MHQFLRTFVQYFSLLSLIPLTISASQDSWPCGNKHKNLVILQKVLKEIPNICVPEFFGIESHRIKEFLEKNCLGDGQFTNYNPFALYTSVINRLNKLGIDGLQDISIAQDLEEVGHRIRFIFEHAWDGKYPFKFTDTEKKFIARLAQEGHYLMVRSTGIEDSVAFANAGANVSKAYIQPEPEEAIELQKAMGEVIASYVTLHSLKNRLANGQVLDTQIFMPVLVQELVGEPLNSKETDLTKIPVSGVAYTTNKQLSDSHLKITEINVAYGHGEGIVSNKVLTDRYYIVPSLNPQNSPLIIPQIYSKEERLIPVNHDNQNIELELIENPLNLCAQCALTNDQLQQLYNALKHIENHYQSPMDVEFVVKENKIYIVQARPAMGKSIAASYLDIEGIEKNKPKNFIKTDLERLVPSNLSVITITNPEEILIAHTLDDADQDPRSSLVKAVIVRTWASPLSHAAVNFMGHGIPCFYSQNLTRIKQLLSQLSEDNPLYIDTQQSLAIIAPQKLVNNYLCSDWCEHPINPRITIANYSQPLKQVIPSNQLLDNYLNQLRSNETKKDRKKTLNQLSAYVDTIIGLSERRIANVWKNNFDVQLQEALTNFKSIFSSITQEAHMLLDKNSYSEFHWLFYIKLIETLIKQNPSETEYFIGGLNYHSFLDTLYFKQIIVVAAQKLGRTPLLSQELLYAKYAPNQEIAQQWIAFIINLDHLNNFWLNYDPHKTTETKLKALTKELQETLALYHSMNCLTLWFSSEFYPIMNNPINKKKSTKLEDILENLLRKPYRNTPC
ncbi:MAG: PEP/pyruvate-binding domain-containing protein [Candidatus Dependentiae bacterium]